MSFIKTTICICLQNFRKWQKDYRIWTIAAILFILMIDCQVKCNTIREKNFEAPRRESEN